MTKIPKSAKPRGRPREFDITAALDNAVRVFRERGYNATSISDLEEATELASGSIYKAFKDKRAVFLAAYTRYQTMRLRGLQIELEKGNNGRDKLRHYLAFYANSSFGKEGKIGCMVVGSAIEIMGLDQELASIVKAGYKRNELQIEELVRLGQADGSISASVDCHGAARLMLCTVQGMRVIGKLGKKKDEMMGVVNCALKALD